MADLIPLLAAGELDHVSAKERLLSLRLLRWGFKIVMWLLFIVWVLAIFCLPCSSLNWMFQLYFQRTQNTIFGLAGSTFLLYSGPILLVAALAYVYVGIFPREDCREKKSKFTRFRLWTFPLLVEGAFGVVSAAEFVGIILFVAYVLWSLAARAVEIYESINQSQVSSLTENTSAWVMDRIGLQLGQSGLFCMAFLFIPVTRGSVLLRLIDVPMEHATRYHVWLGHLTMLCFTLHGLSYAVSWSLCATLIDKMLEWRSIGVANLSGVISLLAGLLMWVTSLERVRKAYFELFFYTHQLYVIFIIFFALHVGDFVYSMAAAGIFLFMLDRFLRFCQSRKRVHVISASCLPCGTIELVLAKPPNLRYNALSFIFLQVRELSWLQWHPFSVSSSPLDGERHIAVLVKVLGGWTARLRDLVASTTCQHNQKEITASVEGPYGHELAYHLKYENLILVAGGIGISPFLAILSDIIHRIQQRKACLVKNILVIWAVKKSQELSLLLSLSWRSSSPSLLDNLNLKIQAYVTQESEPPLEEGPLEKSVDKPSTTNINVSSRISSLVGTGNTVFAGSYFAATTIGFISLYSLLLLTYLQPYNIYAWWLRGLLLLVCMAVSIPVFGGTVVLLWHLWDSKREIETSTILEEQQELSKNDEPNNYQNLMDFLTTQYGRRPNLRDMFGQLSREMGRVDVGVIACGPSTLQAAVAKECRSQNIGGKWNTSIFHFHSHSFDL